MTDTYAKFGKLLHQVPAVQQQDIKSTKTAISKIQAPSENNYNRNKKELSKTCIFLVHYVFVMYCKVSQHPGITTV